MKNSSPLVSILLPVQNAEEYLSDSLESILSQNYKNLEIIAVDDESKDNSLKILKKFRNKDKRIRIYINNNRAGLRKTLNKAIQKARGEYIAFAPDHGRNYVERISKQVSYLLNNPEVAVLGTQASFTNRRKRIVQKTSLPTDPSELSANLIKGGSFIFGSLMVNKLSLPKDLLKFEHDEKEQMFAGLLMKASKYAKLANLEEALIYAPEHLNPFDREFELQNIKSLIKGWVNALLIHDYRPSLRSLLTL